MIIPNRSPARSLAGRAALIACGVALLSMPALSAAETPALQRLEDKAPALPVTTAFEKAADAENAPYVLKVKNDSKESLKVTAQVLLSVAFHATNKARNIPEQEIEPGAVMTIDDLASADKVKLMAEGYAPLEIQVPFKSK